jgi:phosphate transport system protein
MNALETELNKLKSSLLEMWFMVISQLENSRLVIETNDLDLAREIHSIEKLVDAYDLRHDMDCENIIATHHPASSDLRFVISVLKINFNLERIGDYANYNANGIRKSEKPIDPQMIREVKLPEMFDVAHIMLVKSYEAFKTEEINPLRNFSALDKKLDAWKHESVGILEQRIHKNPEEAVQALKLFSIVSKLERVGDHCRNISKEINFHLEDRNTKNKKLRKET